MNIQPNISISKSSTLKTHIPIKHTQPIRVLLFNDGDEKIQLLKIFRIGIVGALARNLLRTSAGAAPP